MYERLKRLLTGKWREKPSEDEFRWYEVGPDNPFGLRVLDCRPITWNLVATTEDPAIAQRYLELRGSNGRQLIDARIPNAVRLSASLRLPHNGAQLEGAAFKSDAMEAKWDIYVYESVFLFARSWTGDLQYRAWATIGETDIHVTEVECPAANQALAVQDVFFLIGSHAMRRVLPHRVPCAATEDPHTIALMSFSLFGRFGCYAAFDDITRIPISRPEVDKPSTQ